MQTVIMIPHSFMKHVCSVRCIGVVCVPRLVGDPRRVYIEVIDTVRSKSMVTSPIRYTNSERLYNTNTLHGSHPRGSYQADDQEHCVGILRVHLNGGGFTLVRFPSSMIDKFDIYEITPTSTLVLTLISTKTYGEPSDKVSKGVAEGGLGKCALAHLLSAPVIWT